MIINSRNPSDLLPRVHTLAEDLYLRAQEEGVDLLITSTFRNFESQKALYAQGRTEAGMPCVCGGKINRIGTCRKHPLGRTVTNAAAGHSWHNWKRAFDVVPVVNGKAVWDDDDLWERIGAWGIECGLEWAGSWKSFPERAHFQLTEGLTLQGLLKESPNGL